MKSVDWTVQENAPTLTSLPKVSVCAYCAKNSWGSIWPWHKFIVSPTLFVSVVTDFTVCLSKTCMQPPDYQVFQSPQCNSQSSFPQGQRKFLSLGSKETLWNTDYTQLPYTNFELMKIIKSDIFCIIWFDLHLCCRRFFSLSMRWLMHMYYLHGKAIVYILII